MTSQLLFGETYDITGISEDRRWLFATGGAQAGSGWMLSSQHQAISEAAFDQFNQTPFRVTTSPTSIIHHKDGITYLLPGSNIHVSSGELFDWKTTIDFKGESRPFEEKADRQELVDIVQGFINSPYLSGGRSLYGLYEASLLHLVFKMGGYIIPNYLSPLVSHGQKIPLESIQMADLIVFGNEMGIPHHLGMYLGGNKMMEVNGKVTISSFDPDWWLQTKADNDGVFHVRNLFP